MKRQIEPLDYKDSISVRNSWHPEDDQFLVYRGPCPFCGTQLRQRYSEFAIDPYWNEGFLHESWACIACGWWWHGTLPDHSYSIGDTYVAVLRLTPSIPPELVAGIAEVRANTERLFAMDPTKFELFVGDILSAFYKCEVVHCGKSHDGGVDLILLDSDLGKIPIQVKRRSKPKSVESVSLVREFRGAMLLNGHDRGKIVSTADHFSPEAVEASTPKPHHLVSQEIELINCRRLLDIMDLLCTPGQHLDNLRGGRHLSIKDPEARRRIVRSLKDFVAELDWSTGR